MAANPEQQPSGGSIEGEFSAETDKLRAAAIERIMDNGFPQAGDPDEGDPNGAVYQPDVYKETWGQVDTYLAAVQSKRSINEPLYGYLQEPENAKALGEVIDQLKSGKAPNDLIAREEDGPPSRRYLSAFIAFESVAKGAIRSEGGQRAGGRPEADLVGPQGEAARRLIRVAEIMDVESNALMIERGLNPLDMAEAGEGYAATFEAFAQRRDVPQIYRERARNMASNLRIDAMKKEKAPAPAPPPQEYRERVRGVDVKLEYDPSHKMFGKENPLTPDDVRQMQGKIEVLTREANPKNAFEVAKLAAHLQRAGVRMGEGKKQIGDYLQRQRLAMQGHGPRALAQYLTYGKYAGCFNELSEQEHKWLLASIQDRIRNDETHKGLARLAMNARYLGVSGYTPELVRQGVLGEIETLKRAGDVEGATKEAARARQAGIDPTATFTAEGQFTGKLKEKLIEHASARRWDSWARLRNNLDSAWRHLPPLEKQVVGLFEYVPAARDQAEKNNQWDTYAEYVANVNELSKREAQRKRGESVAPKTAEVKERGIFERARLTDEEYEAYLGGPEPARAAPVETPIAETSVETEVQEVQAEPVVTGTWWRRFWSGLFGRRERRSSDQENPTNTAA